MKINNINLKKLLKVMTMTRPNVYVTRPIPEEAIELLKERCDVEMNKDLKPLSKQDLIAKLKGRDAILVSRTSIDEEICLAIKDTCKILANYGVGYDNIDYKAATKYGIFVTFNPDEVTEATADQAWALILAVGRRIVECDKYVRAGSKDWGPTKLLGTDISGKTIGIVGGGRVGTAVGKRAKGFGMRIIYTDIKSSFKFEEETGGEFVDKETLLESSDFISLHLPYMTSTYHYISEKELELMKQSAILINTSRGKVVDEKALVKALKNNLISGAGLDVFENEPNLEPGLYELSNVVLTPHTGTSTLDTRIKMGEGCARSIFSVLDRQIPKNCVNPEIGFDK
jgi:lactate dehydrogenase-like 2-hydroxyacid dehydrogenase